MTQAMSRPQPTPLACFAPTHPDVREVTAFLKRKGFSLVLELAPTLPRRGTPAMPAQYHYRDTHNTDVIYLAGPDRPEEEEQRFPPHHTRWWVYPGSSLSAYNEIVQALSAQWSLDWQPAAA